MLDWHLANTGDESDRVPHPAKFSLAVLKVIDELLDEEPDDALILDPFAGTGRIHTLGRNSWGLELEYEWASYWHGPTLVGDSCHLPFRSRSFDIICTSPCYGNRMADSFNAQDGTRRLTYHHSLGRRPSPHSSAVMQWGEGYRGFHARVWVECRRVLKSGGRFILNISDHIRAGKVQPVTRFHLTTLRGLGFHVRSFHIVPTPRMKFGTNANLRAHAEYVIDLWRE
jgi:DNA modification methylase